MFERSKKAASRAKRLIAVAAVPALSFLALSLTPHPSDTDANAMYVVSGEPYSSAETLAGDVFLTDSTGGLVSRKDGRGLALTAGTAVTVIHQDEPLSAVAGQETVAALLERLEVQPSPLEMVSVAFLEGAVEIRIDSEFVFYEHTSTVTEHETVYQYNDEKPEWEETVLQEGSDGEYREVYEVIYQDGEETARQLIDLVDTQPVPTIIEKGHKGELCQQRRLCRRDQHQCRRHRHHHPGERRGPHLPGGPHHEGHRLHHRRQGRDPDSLRHNGACRRGGG